MNERHTFAVDVEVSETGIILFIVDGVLIVNARRSTFGTPAMGTILVETLLARFQDSHSPYRVELTKL